MRRSLGVSQGVHTIFHHDEFDDLSYIQQVQDVEPLLDENKGLQNMIDGYSPSRELRRIASIPVTVLDMWGKADGVFWHSMAKREFTAWVYPKLRDPENSAFRTCTGVI